MWHVSSRSGVATLRTVIHLLLTYLPGRSVLLPRDAGTIAIALCLSDCLSVTSRCSIETVEQIGFFCMKAFSTYPTLCFNEVQVSAKIRLLPSGTFF